MNGKTFEKHIQESAKEAFVYRLRDTTASFSNNMRYAVGNYGDFLIFNNFNLFFLEAKVTKGKNLAYNRLTKSQHKGLRGIMIRNQPGLHATVLINFYEENKIILMDYMDMYSYMMIHNRKSWPIDFLMNNGIIMTIQDGKRVLFNLEEGLDKLILLKSGYVIKKK